MNKIFILSFLSIVLSFFFMYGCSQPRINHTSLSKEGNIVYYQGEPFTGIAYSMYEPDSIRKEISYENGLRSGESKFYFRNGQLNKLVTFDRDTIHGSYESYRYNGELVIDEFIDFNEPNIVRGENISSISNPDTFTGIVVRYISNKDSTFIAQYNNGKSTAVWEYKELGLSGKRKNKLGNRNGFDEKYYQNGRLASIGYFKGTTRDSTHKTYWENGNLMRIQNYSDGKIYGESKEYYENGNLKRLSTYDSTYSNYTQKGPYELYYENGQLEEKSTKYPNDSGYIGELILYYENGQVKEKVNYSEKGILDGKYLAYHENGQLATKVTYVEGNKDGEYLAYYENGQLGIKVTYVEGNKVGNYVEYYANGQLASKSYYNQDGNEIGPYVEYFSDGKLKTEVEKIDDGIYQKPCEIYTKNGFLFSSSMTNNCKFYRYKENGGIVRLYPQ